jgi:plastocyanin
MRSLGLNLLAALWLWGSCAWAAHSDAGSEKAVTVHVKIQDGSSKNEKNSAALNASEVVVWLKPLDRSASVTPDPLAKRAQVVQRNKSFHPHLTVVRIGSVVDFPNRDPFFHNVFSLFDGKRFDLGLYEAGATNSVKFDHVGVSYLFCNIHPEMSAVVVALDTPYYGVSDKAGNVTIENVPDGRYELHAWYERGVQETLKGLTHNVRIATDARDLGTIVVQQDPAFTPTHKNKYGQDYAPPPTPGYAQP